MPEATPWSSLFPCLVFNLTLLCQGKYSWYACILFIRVCRGGVGCDIAPLSPDENYITGAWLNTRKIVRFMPGFFKHLGSMEIIKSKVPCWGVMFLFRVRSGKYGISSGAWWMVVGREATGQRRAEWLQSPDSPPMWSIHSTTSDGMRHTRLTHTTRT